MISQEDKDLIRQEILEERHTEEQEEQQLYLDEEYALEQLVDSDLIDIYDKLIVLSSKINKYGWNISIHNLMDRLKEIG